MSPEGTCFGVIYAMASSRFVMLCRVSDPANAKAADKLQPQRWLLKSLNWEAATGNSVLVMLLRAAFLRFPADSGLCTERCMREKNNAKMEWLQSLRVLKDEWYVGSAGASLSWMFLSSAISLQSCLCEL